MEKEAMHVHTCSVGFLYVRAINWYKCIYFFSWLFEASSHTLFMYCMVLYDYLPDLAVFLLLWTDWWEITFSYLVWIPCKKTAYTIIVQFIQCPCGLFGCFKIVPSMLLWYQFFSDKEHILVYPAQAFEYFVC